MRVLYLAGFKYPHSTENYVSHALAVHGCEVKKLRDARSTFRGAKWHCRNWRPDFVLFAKSSKPWTGEFITWCRRNRFLTVCWQWDLIWGYRRGSLPQFRADRVFTTDGGHPGSWSERNINHEVIRQGIHKPEHVKLSANYRHDVAFVGRDGRHSRDRRRLLRHLSVHHNVKHYTDCRGIDLNRAMSECKIVVGDSVNVKNYWSNRVYEITGRGGFMLHPQTVGLESDFQDGLHIATYARNDMADLSRQIERYLDDDAGREAIRDAGWRHCGECHTYERRVQGLLAKCGLSCHEVSLG